MNHPIEKYLDCSGDITEYVVRGARINCSAGLYPDVLNMPFSHGIFLKNQPQANITDSVSGKNIISFGMCSITRSRCVPAILSRWINMSRTKLMIDDVEALLKNASLFCTVGGRIRISSSGQ